MNDDLLVEIFDFCCPDNISPNTYPWNWWYTLSHVCQRWRRVLFATPARLGISLVCNSRTPVKELLANSPPLPLIIYWGNPGTFDTDDSLRNVLRALKHPDRVRRITLHMHGSSLHKIFSFAKGPFPILETLQLYCSLKDIPRISPSMLEAPNLRHLQLSDLTFLSSSKQLLNPNAIILPSIVTFSLGEITTKPTELLGLLKRMPRLKVLKIGVSFSIPSERTERSEKGLLKGDQPESAPLDLPDLEELEYKGTSDYLEAIAARITVHSLKKLTIEVSNAVDYPNATTFRYLSQLISGAADLSFEFARVRFKDGFSIVMDHNELWTGRGAFELIFKHRGYYFNVNTGLVANICRVLAPMSSTVQSLLLEDGNRNNWEAKPDREGWRELLRLFDNIKTLRVAGRFVESLDEALEPDNEGSAVQTLLPRLREIVRFGPKSEFAAFVKDRQVAGSPVHVVSGPQGRLTLL